MSRSERDLFDDSTMSFGEHLEELRTRILHALYGILLGSIVGLFFGGEIVAFVREPLDDALRKYQYEDQIVDLSDKDLGDWFLDQLGWSTTELPEDNPNTTEGMSQPDEPAGPESTLINVEIPAPSLAAAIRQLLPNSELPPDEALANTFIPLTLRADEFGRYSAVADQGARPVTHGVTEAFMTYFKVSVIAGVLLSSPWIFYQIWLFVAAGLYPHERAWVKRYGWISFVLFFSGALFCFYIVLPFVLNFMLGFNRLLELPPQFPITQWISFVTFLPVVFGISFQLPIVMLFLERIHVFEVTDYREKWRIAVFVIAVISMLLTPTDPTSMLAMMVPLCFLYWVGIKMCDYAPPATPFDDAVPEPAAR